jgi:hypothetical protein
VAHAEATMAPEDRRNERRLGRVRCDMANTLRASPRGRKRRASSGE